MSTEKVSIASVPIERTSLNTDLWYTKMGATNSFLKWKIYDLADYSELSRNSLKSPVFSSEDKQLVWSIELKFVNSRVGKYMKFDLSLHLSSKCELPVVALVKTCIVRKDEKQGNHYTNSTITFTENLNTLQIISNEQNYFLSAAGGFLDDGCFTILCKVKTLRSMETFPIESIKTMKPKTSEIEPALLQFFEEQKFCDITLVVGERKFKAHKIILAAQSSVFSAMFSDNYKEGKENFVEITDIRPEVVGGMLQFIYGQSMENISIMAEHLLAAADKYELERLRIRCEQKLLQNICIEDAADTLVLAAHITHTNSEQQH